MIISDEIEIEDKVLANGGFADVRIGRHKGQCVAVKTLRTAAIDDLRKIRKVSLNITIVDIRRGN
jgi:hypothetical protein